MLSYFLAICTSFLLYIGTSTPEAGAIITVQGPIKPSQLGKSLIHEHTIVDWIGADSTGYHRWDTAAVIQRVLPFLQEIKAQGVQSFFDCTPAYLGRDPYVLEHLARRTGIQMVTNTGYYGARNNKYVPRHALEQSPEEMAQHWIWEFEHGIDSSGIRPGFIKIAVDRDSVLSPVHERIVQAAALTHLRTGLTIVSHTGPDGPAFAQLEVLRDMGVSPAAFVWTHAQNGTLEGYLKAAEMGAWISLDHVSGRARQMLWYMDVLPKVKQAGILSNILLSHDAGWYNVGQEEGGRYRGHDAIFTTLIPALLTKGFNEADIRQLLVTNPAAAYPLRIRKYRG